MTTILMKAAFIAAIWGLGALATLAQGTVLFGNRVVGSVDAHVRFPPVHESFPTALDSRFAAQLWGGPPGGPLLPAGAPVPFRDSPDAARGYIAPVIREIPNVAAGSPAEVKMVAWYRGLGSSYQEAQAMGLGGYGESSVVLVSRTSNPLVPPPPLVGLQGFLIGMIPGVDSLPDLPTPFGLPGDPRFEGQFLDFFPTLDEVLDIVATQGRAYVAAGGAGLIVLDILDPSAPSRMGSSFLNEDQSAVAVVHRHPHAYVVTRRTLPSGQLEGALEVVNVQVPTVPLRIGGVALSGEPQDVALVENHALVAAGTSGLYVIDIRNGRSPLITSRLDTEGEAARVVFQNGLAYVADRTNGMVIVDVTQTDSPVTMGRYAGSLDTVAVAVRDQRAYVVDIVGGVHIVDISDATQPRLESMVPMNQSRSVDIVLGDLHAFVAHSREGFSVLDIEDRSEVRVIGGIGTLKRAERLSLADDHVWVADGIGLSAFQVGPGLRLIPSRGLELSGTIGRRYVIEHRSSLDSVQGWQPLTAVVLSTNPQLISTLSTLRDASQFFRVQPQ